MDYSFRQKDHWRNRIWNQLSQRVTVHPRDAVVLYLAAETDFDRTTARKKGFHEHNLIAIDRDAAVVDRLRSEGKLALCAELGAVLRAWPIHTPVHAVCADLCCGLEDAVTWNLIESATLAPFKDCVFATNMLRGRDASSRKWRDHWANICSHNKTKYNPKHRGLAAAGWFADSMKNHLCRINGISLDAPQDRPLRQCLLNHVYSKMRQDSGSYRSACGQYFDWSIWSTSIFASSNGIADQIDSMTKVSISAILAHRTRRMG